jgi:hypothetical protein
MLMAGSSCVKKDNFDAPDASLEGSLIEEGTKSNIQTCTGNVNIRLEQLNWSETPAPQDIPIKIDGSFKNSKLFKGGAFWATEPVEIDINKGTKQDFQLIPYVLITNLRHELIGDSLKLNFDMEAPIESGLPTIIEIQPFVNTTRLVGPGASIFDFSDLVKTPVNKEWVDFTPAEKSREIIIPDLIRGRTFFVRVGVRFNDNEKNSNLSEVIEINIPQ